MHPSYIDKWSESYNSPQSKVSNLHYYKCQCNFEWGFTFYDCPLHLYAGEVKSKLMPQWQTQSTVPVRARTNFFAVLLCLFGHSALWQDPTLNQSKSHWTKWGSQHFCCLVIVVIGSFRSFSRGVPTGSPSHSVLPSQRARPTQNRAKHGSEIV